MRANQDQLGHVNTQHGSLYRDGGGPLRGLLEGLALAPQTESIVNVSRKPESSGAMARWGAHDEMTMRRFYQRGEARWRGNASSEYPIPSSRKFSKVEKDWQHPNLRFGFSTVSDCRRRSAMRRTAAGRGGGTYFRFVPEADIGVFKTSDGFSIDASPLPHTSRQSSFTISRSPTWSQHLCQRHL